MLYGTSIGAKNLLMFKISKLGEKSKQFKEKKVLLSHPTNSHTHTLLLPGYHSFLKFTAGKKNSKSGEVVMVWQACWNNFCSRLSYRCPSRSFSFLFSQNIQHVFKMIRNVCGFHWNFLIWPKTNNNNSNIVCTVVCRSGNWALGRYVQQTKLLLLLLFLHFLSIEVDSRNKARVSVLCWDIEACRNLYSKNAREVWRSTTHSGVLLHTPRVFLQIPKCFYNSK